MDLNLSRVDRGVCPRLREKHVRKSLLQRHLRQNYSSHRDFSVRRIVNRR
jgi:hypothetical protein